MEVTSNTVPIKTSSITEEYIISWDQKLGTGVNGPVRPCKHIASGESFALKLLKDSSSSYNEINLHSRCANHPNVVQIHEVFSNMVQFPKEDGPQSRLMVVMELMDGGELFDRISKEQRFTERKAVRFTKQIALAIERCHTLNIAHRDLKPENLLLKDNSENAPVKLGDFGFAKVDDGSLMTPHFTPYYAAPQVLEAKKREQRSSKGLIPTSQHPYTYDKSCDMWSLGVIVYIMLCGYPPFCPATPTVGYLTPDMQNRIMAGQYEFPFSDWRHISVEAKDVVKRLLMVDPQERMAVKELLDHPWLQENKAPETVLNSPAVLLDKNLLYEAKETHSAQLTHMRIPERNFTLKPVAKANNPIVRKRLRSRLHSIDNKTIDDVPAQPKHKKQSEGLKRLRDVIAHCIMPPKGSDEARKEDILCELVMKAWEYNSDSQNLQESLEQLQWNGKYFDEKVDPSVLALTFRNIIKQMNHSSYEDINSNKDEKL